MTLPEAFITRTKKILGDEFDSFVEALKADSPTSIRVNNKTNELPTGQQVPWCNEGCYLPERPLFTSDPLFHAGTYYVQEASSMFLYQAIKQHFPNAGTVLDLCAAPGGKSTLLSQTIPTGSLLVSNEIIRSRAYILAENIIKWGNPNVVVTNCDASEFSKLPAFFDAIIVDAPCSGEGMFRKDPGAIEEWSMQNVEICANRQREILSKVWDSLKTDGILVYSTCTYNLEENEENVEWICNELGADILNIDCSNFPGITETSWGYRFYPHKTKGEGFFLSILRKTSDASFSKKIKKVVTKGIKFAPASTELPFSLHDVDKWKFVLSNNQLHAFDAQRADDILTVSNTLNCLHTGIPLGEYKGKDFIPSHAVALSKALDLSKTTHEEVDYETAIRYLRRESIVLENESRGYVLICYKGMPLGWVKNLGNRSNNMYPNEWRIRMKI